MSEPMIPQSGPPWVEIMIETWESDVNPLLHLQASLDKITGDHQVSTRTSDGQTVILTTRPDNVYAWLAGPTSPVKAYSAHPRRP